MDISQTRVAVVTGANKGLGLEMCRQLSLTGITVILTARDEQRGLEALKKLEESAGDNAINVIFHRLDVTDTSTIPPLVDFVKAKFGKLDILINNAAILGSDVDWKYMKDVIANSMGSEVDLELMKDVNYKPRWTDDKSHKFATSHTYEMTEECFQVNYYGTKNMMKAFVPLLQQSDSPRILNVSSSHGRLQYVTNEWAKGVLNNVKHLTEERIDDVVNEFLKDYKDEKLEAKGWPNLFASYILSKAVLNAYTRVAAKEFSGILINCACPSYVKTTFNDNNGVISVEEGAGNLVKVALASNGMSGRFFYHAEVSSFE